MERYNVYMYNIPKVGEDGKPVSVNPHQTQEFSQLGDATKHATEHKDEFDRVVVMRTVEEEQKLIERFIDGEHTVPEKEEKDE